MNAMSILWLPVWLAAAASEFAPAPAPDLDAATAEAVSTLQAYLRIDTTNPPGRERAAADFLHAIFEREGIESRVYDLGGGRANVLARLAGRGGRRPLILLNHMDVVP